MQVPATGAEYAATRPPHRRMPRLDTLAVYPGELKPFDPAVDIADVQQVMIEQMKPAAGAEDLDPDDAARRDHRPDVAGCPGAESEQDGGRIVRVDAHNLAGGSRTGPSRPDLPGGRRRREYECPSRSCPLRGSRPWSHATSRVYRRTRSSRKSCLQGGGSRRALRPSRVARSPHGRQERGCGRARGPRRPPGRQRSPCVRCSYPASSVSRRTRACPRARRRRSARRAACGGRGKYHRMDLGIGQARREVRANRNALLRKKTRGRFQVCARRRG